MPAARSNDQLLDLLLMGLTWVQEETGTPTGWTGNGVLRTMQYLGAVSDQQYFQLARGHQDFRAFLVPLAHMVFGRTFSVSTMRRACSKTDKLLVVAVNTPMFFGDKLFIPGGYKLAASEAGQRRALQAAARYEPYITRDGFHAQWRAHRRQMAGMNATSRQLRTRTES